MMSEFAEVDNDYIKQEFLHDHQILVFTIKDTSHEALDAFAEVAQSTYELWSSDTPFLTLFDFSADNLHFGAYARARIEQIVESIPSNLTGAYAVVIAKFHKQMIQLFMRRSHTRTLPPQIQQSLFTSREKALEWLESKLTQS